MTLQVVLECNGDGHGFPEGTSFIGRDPTAQLYLRDVSVSRRHLKLRVFGNQVTAEDLGSANGTRVNGVLLRGPRALRAGDVLQLGDKVLRLRIEHDHYVRRAFEEITAVRSEIPEVIEETPTARNCRHCSSRVPFDHDKCTSCHRPLGVLAEETRLKVTAVPPRQAVSVAYLSENLTFDSSVKEWSPASMFIETSLLEAIGTRCKVVVEAPHGVLTYHGVVRDVEKNRDGRRPGMHIEFVV